MTQLQLPQIPALPTGGITTETRRFERGFSQEATFQDTRECLSYAGCEQCAAATLWGLAGGFSRGPKPGRLNRLSPSCPIQKA